MLGILIVGLVLTWFGGFVFGFANGIGYADRQWRKALLKLRDEQAKLKVTDLYPEKKFNE